MWASLLSRPCTSSTAKLSVCREAVPFRAPFLLERLISPIRSAIVICCKTQLKSYIDLHVQLYPSTRLYWSTSNFQIVQMKKKTPSTCGVLSLTTGQWSNSPLWCLFSFSLTPVRLPWLGLGDREARAPTICCWRWQLVSSPGMKKKTKKTKTK